MQTTIRILFAALAATFALEIQGAEKMLLRQHWEPGKLYRQENVTDMTMTLPGLGAAGEQKTNIVQTLTIGVTKEAGTDHKLAKVEFTAIKAAMTMMGQVMVFDSTDPAKSQPLLQQSFGAMVGKGFTFVYDKDDKFVDVRGFEAMAATPLGNAQAMDGKQMADMFRKTSEMALPRDPVAVGDTWEFQETMDMPPIGKMTIKVKGKFDSVGTRDGRKEAKLLLTGTFSTEGPENPIMKISDGSKFEGVTLFDLDRRVVTSNVTTTDLALNVQGQNAPMKQTVTTELTGVEDLKGAGQGATE